MDASLHDAVGNRRLWASESLAIKVREQISSRLLADNYIILLYVGGATASTRLSHSVIMYVHATPKAPGYIKRSYSEL